MSFAVTPAMEIKKVALLDLALEDVSNGKDDLDAGSIFDSQFTLVSGELRSMLNELTSAIGERAEGLAAG